MTGSYCADLRQAADVIAALTDVERELDDVIVDLRWRVAHLHGSFTGRSADAHQVAHQRFTSAYDEMTVALADMRRALDSASTRYSRAAEANVTLWRQVR